VYVCVHIFTHAYTQALPEIPVFRNFEDFLGKNPNANISKRKCEHLKMGIYTGSSMAFAVI